MSPMDPIYRALNALGNVPWKINAPVADVVEQVWELCREGGGLAGLPPREVTPLPEKPEYSFAEEARGVWRDYKKVLTKVRGPAPLSAGLRV